MVKRRGKAESNMPAKKTPKPSVQMRQPAQYLFSHMVNRFSLDRQEGFVVANFGLINRDNELLDRFACILPQSTLDSCKDNLVEFSEKIGLPKNKIPVWNPKALFREATQSFDYSVIDFIHLTYWEDAHAELCFWNYSRAQLADMVQMGGSQFLNPWGVALIRCDIDLQRAFLAELYTE